MSPGVLVDTPVWSLALRRKSAPRDRRLVDELDALILDGHVLMLGVIRQEILSGLHQPTQFARLRDHLRAFPDLPLDAEDYEDAAAFFNLCRERGIQGSNGDFLICAVAARRESSIFTTDKDFARYASLLPVRLHSLREPHGEKIDPDPAHLLQQHP